MNHFGKLSKGITEEGRGFIREVIRRYFKHTCQLCGKRWLNGRRFDVHNQNRKSGYDRKYENGIDFKKVSLTCHACTYKYKKEMTDIDFEEKSLPKPTRECLICKRVYYSNKKFCGGKICLLEHQFVAVDN